MSADDRLEIISNFEGVDGLQVFYPPAPLPSDPDKLVQKLSNFNLKVADLYIDFCADRRFKHGAFCTTERGIKKETIKLFKEGIDFAKEIGAYSVLLANNIDLITDLIFR